MPRGSRDIEKTRRIIRKILKGVLFKQIAFEEKIPEPRVSFIKARYLQQTVELTLNERGINLMNEEQLSLFSNGMTLPTGGKK